MKTKLILLVTAIALTGMTDSASASDRRMIYNSKGQLIAMVPDPSDTGTRVSSDMVNYVPGFNSKGGMTLVPSRESTTTVALYKSKKPANCDTACCPKH